MNRKLLATAICATLALSAWAGAAQAQQDADAAGVTANQDQTSQKEAKELQKVTVTGSLIPQAQIETASPVITITSDTIEKQGFRNVYDALRAQPLSTGSVQDNQFTAGFTPGANTISLLGLSPNFTLFLIDGHPLADYPLLYNGSANFVDISSIPVGMVDHIDILPGNQSSIYGSSAIAGVVNIILKKRIDGSELTYRVGGYSDGGGQNQRLQFNSGYNSGRFNMVYGLQVNDQHPIFGFQRDLTKSTNSNPDPTQRYAPRDFLRLIYPASYVDPGVNGCDAVAGLFGGTVKRDFRPGRGYYCGSREEVGYSSILNKNRAASGYVSAQFQLNDNTELYGDLLYNVSSNRFYAGPNYNFFVPNNNNYIFNANSGQFELWQRTFAPEETGGPLANAERTLSRSYNATAGVRGNFGDSDWAYDAYFARSEYKITDKQLRPLKGAVNAFFEKQFLGPQLGTYYGYPVYAPDQSKFFQPITPADYRSFVGEINSKSKTYTQNVNLQVTNSSLFELPAGSVGFAGVLQAGNSYWDNPTDPRVINGDFWGLTGTSGGGKRDNYAAAAEFRVPIFSMLTADISGRYDDYKNKGGGSDNRTTYKLGLEFRPTESLLFRGNYATAFRAPDLAYTFAGQNGFFTSVTDYYRCAKLEPNVDIDNCTYNPSQIQGAQTGNRDLKSITAKSWGYGVVWSPTSNFNIKADYYNINISNEVLIFDLNTLFLKEAGCRLGQINNPQLCNYVESAITRNPENAPANPLGITGVTIVPINISSERVSGIVASLNYKLDAGRYGDFDFGADYNVTMDHRTRLLPGDPEIDLLRNPFYSSEFKTIFSGSVSWEIGKWTTTLYGIRYGATPNYAAQVSPKGYATVGGGTVAPYMVYNGSVKYNVTDDASIGLYVNNIKNSGPPVDKSWNAWPYYNRFNYNVYGRAYWLEFDIRFGAGKG